MGSGGILKNDIWAVFLTGDEGLNTRIFVLLDIKKVAVGLRKS